MKKHTFNITMGKYMLFLCLVVITNIATAQNIKRYEGMMMLPSDLDELQDVISTNGLRVGGEGYYEYYENNEEQRVKHGKFFLNVKGYAINGSYSHGKKTGQWTITHPVENGYIKSYHNNLKITYKDDVFCGPCEYITRASHATVTITCNFNNGIITGKASVLYNYDVESRSVTSECCGNIDKDGLIHGLWIVSDKGGIEITQKRLYNRGALIYVEEQDLSTGDKTTCYTAFEKQTKLPDFERIADTIINGREGIVYNGQIAIREPSKNISFPSHVKSSVFSIMNNLPNSMTRSVSLEQQIESWYYAYTPYYQHETQTYTLEMHGIENQDIFSFEDVEEKPSFPGGDKGLMEYVAKRIKYPQLARESGIQGRVFVGFVIEPNGDISNIEVLRGIGGGCDQEAVRLIKNMPKWEPGKQHGTPVRVSFMVPITFKL